MEQPKKNNFFEVVDVYAWNGYDFDMINDFDEDYIVKRKHSSRNKRVYLIDEGMEYVK